MPRDGPATLVASTILPRAPGLFANQLPMMVSVAPKVSARAGTEYISAVSMKSTPRSSERSRMAMRVGLVDLLAEGHGAQADGGDLQAAGPRGMVCMGRRTTGCGRTAQNNRFHARRTVHRHSQGSSPAASRAERSCASRATPPSTRSACSGRRIVAPAQLGQAFPDRAAATSRCACTSCCSAATASTKRKAGRAAPGRWASREGELNFYTCSVQLHRGAAGPVYDWRGAT